MALAYCTVDKVQYLLRQDGMYAHADDVALAMQHTESDANIASAIDIASAIVFQHVGERYKEAVLTNESYPGCRTVQWWTAWLAAHSLVTRSGNPATTTVKEQVESIMSVLRDVQARHIPIAGLPERVMERPTVENYRHQLGGMFPLRVKVNQSSGGSSSRPRPIDWRDILYAGSFYGHY